MKGIESLPMKYITMIIAAAIIVAALLHVTGLLSETAITGTAQANQTINTILEESLGDIIKGTGNP